MSIISSLVLQVEGGKEGGRREGGRERERERGGGGKERGKEREVARRCVREMKRDQLRLGRADLQHAVDVMNIPMLPSSMVLDILVHGDLWTIEH